MSHRYYKGFATARPETSPFILDKVAVSQPPMHLQDGRRLAPYKVSKAPPLQLSSHKQGEIVYSHFWDSGAPGAGADCESVYRLYGCYFARDSNAGFSGPFDTLDEALQEGGLVQVTSATVSIECAELSTTALIARLKILEAEVGQIVTINGNRRRVTRNGRLGRIT